MKKFQKSSKFIHFSIILFLLLILTPNLGKYTVAEVISREQVGRAVVLRMNDVIYQYYNNIDLDISVRMQKEMISNPVFTRITIKKINEAIHTLAFNKLYAPIETTEEAERIVSDTISIINTNFGDAYTKDPSFKDALLSEVQDGINALSYYTNNITSSSYIITRYPFIRFFLILYSFTVSPIGIIILICIILCLLLYEMKTDDKVTVIKSVSIDFIFTGIIEGILMSAAIKFFSISLASNILGRAMQLRIHYFAITGIILLIAGILLQIIVNKKTSLR